jgi:hypothetical protein
VAAEDVVDVAEVKAEAVVEAEVVVAKVVAAVAKVVVVVVEVASQRPAQGSPWLTTSQPCKL